jgi:LysM repeat protein
MAVATSADAARKKALQSALAAAKKKAPVPKAVQAAKTADAAKKLAALQLKARKAAADRAKGFTPKAPSVKPAEVKAAAVKAPSNLAKVKGLAGKAAKQIRRVPGGSAALKVGKFAVGGKVGMGLTAGALVAGPLFKKLNDTAQKGSVRPGAVGQSRGSVVGWKPASGTPKGARSVPSNNVAPTPKKAAAPATTKYRVETGDTLSGIAARAGVTLAELRAANPQLQGKGIFRNTGVNIPKKGKKPTPEYTGPVPFRPGSAAAKKYEASRKKK